MTEKRMILRTPSFSSAVSIAISSVKHTNTLKQYRMHRRIASRLLIFEMVLVGSMNLCSGFMNAYPRYKSMSSLHVGILPSIYTNLNKNTGTLFVPSFNTLSWKGVQDFTNTCVGTAAATRRFGIISSDGLRTRPTFRMGDVKIAIVGGGICGVTAAHAIKTRLQTIAPNQKVEIVIYEGDDNSYNGEEIQSQAGFKNMRQPTWKAATAKNANSLGESSQSQRNQIL